MGLKMAYYAKLDENNMVIEVHTISNAETHDKNGVEHEQMGIDFLNSWQGYESKWVQTSWNNRIRKNYAGVGYKYDPVRDAFIPPKPYESWILDEKTCRWIAPVEVPQPIKGIIWVWNESALAWQSLKGMEI
jgi:hypothetical protein